jgi:dienelactone hydrolase
MGAQGVVFQTSVAPHPDDDLAAPCQYELTLTDRSRTIRAVWVIFDRGRDILRIYGDPDVQRFAQRHDWALLMPFHCRSKSEGGDMNVEPARGLGRALFAALGQLALRTDHPELAAAPLVLLGFSGTGSLVGRFAAYAPDRVAAIVASDPGHFDPLGVDTIDLSPTAAAIPQLVLAGSSDRISGTERPYAYFRRHFDRGAPWTFVVQNNAPHCCVINAKALMLEWLEAVVVRKGTRAANHRYGFITTSPSEAAACPTDVLSPLPIWCPGTTDTWGGANWSVSAATVQRGSNGPENMLPAGWLPTRRFADLWVAFVRQRTHPITSLP